MTRQTSGEGAARARVIAFANQKGGVAKSTTAEAFAASLTARGYAVLMVDMDAQPRVAGVVVTRYDAHNSLEPEMLDQIAEIAAEYDAPLLGRGVRNTVAARKAQYNGVALGEFAPRSTAALDYEEVVSAYLDSVE